ncbi:MAG: AzlC family ABC transporter permease [Eggerthellaceae bacterium]|jgi:4-azaleucine resistance transporter AzlC
MLSRAEIKDAFVTALPIIAGYVGIGIPCGILEQQVGMDWLMALVLSFVFYSGAGQFMIPSLVMAGNPLLAIIASVSFVNLRQTLYSASLSQYCQHAGKLLSFFFAAGVTDESFGVNIQRFRCGDWKVEQGLAVNLMCCTSWAVSNALGVVLGNLIALPTAIGMFAMTSIFICLLCSQQFTHTTVVVAIGTVLGVIFFKLVGLSTLAILGGALVGIAAGLAQTRLGQKRQVG